MAALLHPDEGEVELDDRVANDVERRLVDEVDEDRRPVDDDPQARSTFEEAVKENSRVSGKDIRLGANGLVRLVIEPEAFVALPQTCAFTRLWLQAETIVVRAEIVYPNLETARGLPNR